MIQQTEKNEKFIHRPSKSPPRDSDRPEIPEEELNHSDERENEGVQVTSEDPGAQEWGARKEVNDDKKEQQRPARH